MGVGQAAVVELEVGYQARFFIGAILFDKCTFVFGMVDESALV